MVVAAEIHSGPRRILAPGWAKSCEWTLTAMIFRATRTATTPCHRPIPSLAVLDCLKYGLTVCATHGVVPLIEQLVTFLLLTLVRTLGKRSTSSWRRATEERITAGACWKGCTATTMIHREAVMPSSVVVQLSQSLSTTTFPILR